MKRTWGIVFTLLTGSALAACANILGADGDYEIAAASGASGAVSGSAASGAGGDPAATASASTSASSSTGSATSGAGGAGGAPSTSWHRYSFDLGTKTWSSALLSSVWTGVNAPPSTDILATCHLDHFDKLLVFTNKSVVHIQEANVWLPPVSSKELFPIIETLDDLGDIYHVPSEWDQASPSMPLLEKLTLVKQGVYWDYNLTADGTTFGGANFIPAPTKPSQPPVDTLKAQWVFSIWNKSAVGSTEGFVTWSTFGNGQVYKHDATDSWSSWPVESGPLWAGKPGAPDWTKLEAAYFDGNSADGTGTIMFIGP